MTGPVDVLDELRRIHEHEPDRLDGALPNLGLTPISGGRNNRVYRWDSPEGPICLKLYRTDKRNRAGAETLALGHMAEHGVAGVPRLLWHDEHPVLPAVAMTLVPGTPLDAGADLDKPLSALTSTLRQMFTVPIGPFADLPRSESAAHYIHRITQVWAPALRSHTPDACTRDLERLLASWHDSGDAQELARPAPLVFSHGDSNLLNWLWDEQTATISVVDFEFAGASDLAYEAAELVEHISMRSLSDDVLRALVTDLGVDAEHGSRFVAAQRTCALRWLAVLWKQRERRAEEFHVQLERVRTLQSAPFV